MPSPTPSAQLTSFLAKYTPDIAARAKAILAAMRKAVPGATELVYDNYNALAIGFGPTDSVGDVVFSIAAYPQWVSLFFMQAAGLPDPEKRLRGSGVKIRHIVLDSAADLSHPVVAALMRAAQARARRPIDPAAHRRLIIKSVSTRQRPRRPARRS